MATRKERTHLVRTELEKELGVKFREMLPAKDKVLIMQYLLEQPAEKLRELTNDKYPAFIALSARLLVKAQINDFMDVYAQFQDEANGRLTAAKPQVCNVSYINGK